MQEKEPNLISWLGLRASPDFSKARWLGGLITSVVVLMAVAIFSLTLIRFFEAAAGLTEFSGAEEQSAAIRNTGLVLAAVIGVPFLVWRSVVAHMQVTVAEQGQITDRINKAVDGLGATKSVKRQRVNSKGKKVFEKGELEEPDFSKPVMEEISEPNLEVRIGAIYALERIAQDSPRDHIQIVDVICAYIRNNAQQTNLTVREAPFKRATIRPDVQVALQVLGRRRENGKRIERQRFHRMDLSGTDLSGADFSKGDFFGAILANCRLEACDFDETDLGGAQFQGSLLCYSTFWNTKLVGADFSHSKISPTKWTTSINRAELSGACFFGADLSDLKIFPPRVGSSITVGNGDTKLYYHIERLRKDAMEAKEEFELSKQQDASIEDIEAKLRDSGFFFWTSYPNEDLVNPEYHQRLLKDLGLDAWPYWNYKSSNDN